MNETKPVWPNLFVVGAQKCGTTSIFGHLQKHPEVFVPEMKEPEFFGTSPGAAKILFGEGRCTTREEYLQQYQDASRFHAIGDFSTSYLWDPNVPRKIHEVSPGARIIIMLRDPVMRAQSAYLMLYSRNMETAPTFLEAIERDRDRDKTSWFTSWNYVEAGMYASQVERYIETFGRDQVLVSLFDDLVKNPLDLFLRIARHIGVDPAPFVTMNLTEALNTFRMPRSMLAYRLGRNEQIKRLRQKLIPADVWERMRSGALFYRAGKKPPVDEASRKLLQQIYAPDIIRLEELLGRKMPELRKSWD
ncbi:MAG: sulfotransferase [Terracidiphilus sp.]|jgi:hypothetical protein